MGRTCCMEILKTKKRLTVFCIMLACVFALSFALAYAVSAPRQASATIETSHVDHEATAFSSLGGTNSLDGGDYYLDGDFNLSGLTIFGEVYLCLNGHTLTIASDSVLNIDSSASLTILDCQGGGKIVFATGEMSMEYGVECYGRLTLNGGTLESARNKLIQQYSSSIINVNGGTINYIKDMDVIDYYTYNAICNNNGGTLNISGGKIKGAVFSNVAINLDGYTDTANPIDYCTSLAEYIDNNVIANNVADAGVINIKNPNCIVETDGSNNAIACWANTWTIILTNCTSGGQLTQIRKFGEAFETVTITADIDATLPDSVEIEGSGPEVTYTNNGDGTATISGVASSSKGSATIKVRATKPHIHDVVNFSQQLNNDNINYVSGGNYYLTEDVTVGHASFENVHLCLNGHTITVTESINTYGEVYIYDCDGAGAIRSTATMDGMPLICVHESLYIYGGNFASDNNMGILVAGVEESVDEETHMITYSSFASLYVGGGKFTQFPDNRASIHTVSTMNNVAIAGSPDIKRINTNSSINMSYYTGNPLSIYFYGILPGSVVATDTTPEYVRVLNEGYIGVQNGDNVCAAVPYNVNIVLNNASVVSGGDLSQATIGAINDVVIKADDGYALPASVAESAGITYALSEDGKTATISGTPTANVEFTVNAIMTEYEITLNSNSGGVVANQVVESIGHQLKPAGLPVPTWDGYHRFLGWYTATEGGEVATEQTLSSNIELFAHWAIEYKVTFDAKGGSVDPAYTYTVEGKITILPSAEYDENHVFSAWYTAEKDGEKVTLDRVFTADTTIYARYIVVRSIDHIDKSTEGLVDTYTIYFTDGTTYVFTVTNGADGVDGIDGVDGKTPYIGSNGNWWIGETDTGVSASGSGSGTPGADGKTPQLKINAETNIWEVSYDNGATWTSLGIKATGNDGSDGADGNGIAKIELTKTEGNVDTYTITFTDSTTFVFTVTNGTDGADGADGKKLEMQINAETNTWEYRYEGDAEWISTGVKATGEKGADGADGKTPQLKIGVDNYWYVSYDEGATWTSLGVKATGSNGSDGADGITPQLRINTDTKYWEVSYDNGSTWTSLGVKATGEGSGSGADGVTPQLRINSTNNMWEVSYDNGSTWTSLGVKATGDKGDDGTDGNDGIGIASVEKIKTEGNVDTYRITFTDDSYFDFTVTNGTNGRDGTNGITPKIRINSSTKEWEVSYDDGSTWTSMGVKAIPEQDENGNWVYETSDMGASSGSMDSKQYTTVVVVSCVASLLTIAVAVCVMLIVAKDKRRTQKILKAIMQEKEEK